MNLNPKKIPYSRFGSYIAVRQNKTNQKICISTMHGFWQDEMNLFYIVPYKGHRDLDYKIKMLPWLLTIETDYGDIFITLNKTNGVLIRSKGVGVKIEPIGESERTEGGFDFWNGRLNTVIHCVEGHFDFDTLTTQSDSYKLYMAISGTDTEPLTIPDNLDEFDAGKIEQEYKSWVAPLLSECGCYKDTAELAAHILWNSGVRPCGHITNNTILMSKNWMHYVWAWDHCFNAVALVESYPELAWDQLLVFFNNQMKDGKLPDLIYPNDMNLGETKPPIHGWCFEKLLDAGLKISDKELLEFYNKLTAWTNWWFENRDDDKDGICQYNLNNESGHDNSTVFDEGRPIETPDLTTYLILQIKCLKRISKMLKLYEDEKKWTLMQNDLLNKFYQHCWCEDHFVSVKLGTHQAVESKSIINVMPILLGELLKPECFEKLVEKLSVENDYLSPYGIVTEAMSSSKYNKHAIDWENVHEPDTAYWRGAIWAPVIYFVVDGLRRGGEVALAKEIAKRFCNMVNGQDGIFENYNSATGVGGCDPAYTWTCSVFLLLIKEFLV